MTRYARSLAAGLALCVSLAAAPGALADTSGVAAAARLHFDRGLAFSDRGEIGAAAIEFRRAYELLPHPSVLFNLGRAYAALGRHADAARTLRRYLRESSEIQPSRRAQVESLLAFSSAKVGLLEIDVEPHGAEVVVDGVSLGHAPFSEPPELDAGSHGLLVMAPGHASSFRTIDVKAGERTRLKVSLDAGTAGAEGGQLFVRCRIPGAGLEVDGARLGTTPVTPVVVPAGARRVVFIRDGYSRSEHDVVVPARGEASVTCNMRLEARSPPGAARLRVLGVPGGARVHVDGEPFTGGPLPAGVHDLVVEHADYETWRRSVDLPPGGSQVVDANLEPTRAARRREQAARSREQRTWSAIVGGAGALLAGSGATVYLVNTSRLDRWNEDNDEVASRLAAGSTDPELLQRNSRLQERAASIQRTDDVAIGLVVSGGVAISVALWLWFTADGSVPSSRVGLRSRQPELGFTW